MLEKHIKLDYEVISPSPNDALQKWETAFNTAEIDYTTLESTVKYGNHNFFNSIFPFKIFSLLLTFFLRWHYHTCQLL